MPKRRKAKIIPCRYFRWKISKRNGVWQGDGRSNLINAGRHSLGTRDEKEAIQAIHELDETMAGKLGLIEQRPPSAKSGLTIAMALDKFRKYKTRPKSVGGVEPETMSRYNRILNKFDAFAVRKNIKFITQVNIDFFDEYVAMLEDELDFKLSSIVTEMVLLKGLHQYCIDQKLLDPRFGFKYPLKRPTESLTYCPSESEVELIDSICKANKSLVWLYRVVVVLSNTGLRFGEARDFEWRDIDQDYKLLHVRDESFVGAANKENARKTKTRKSRKVPIHKDLAALLRSMPRGTGKILTGPRGGDLRNDLFGDTLREQVYPKVMDAVGNDDVARLTAHGFRHYFVSKCANLGVPQLSVMKWLGHSTARMTNYYYHANEAASLKHMRDFEAAECSDNVDPSE